jgi:hypothetical protein
MGAMAKLKRALIAIQDAEKNLRHRLTGVDMGENPDVRRALRELLSAEQEVRTAIRAASGF